MKRPLLDDHSRALLEVGFLNKADFVLAGVLLLMILAAIFVWLFGTPTWATYVAMLLLAILDLLVWVVILAFRGMYFTITLKAEILTMPEHAARMAVQALSQVSDSSAANG